MRRRLVAGNWKMNGSVASVVALVQGLTSVDLAKDIDCEVLVCPPTIFLSQVRDLLADAGADERIAIGAQDVSQHEIGAYTGETSVDMLREHGCGYTLVGHSERRQYHSETDIVVAAKVSRSLAAGVRPIVCVGETLAERREGSTLTVVAGQLAAVANVVTRGDWGRFDIAYEPVWAIGTGESASPEQAQEVHGALREIVTVNGDEEEKTRILYGGSVNQDNADSLFAMKDIDGALVGGASLKADSFLSICRSAARLSDQAS